MEKTFYEVPCTTVLQVRVKGRILDGSPCNVGGAKIERMDVGDEEIGW